MKNNLGGFKPLPEIIIPQTNDYRNVHNRIRGLFGKANKCEGVECSGISNRFDWALKPGAVYSVNRDDYQMLCRSCHSKQGTPKGERQAAAKLTEEQVRYIKINPDKLTAKELSQKFGVVRQTVNFIINNINWKHVQI